MPTKCNQNHPHLSLPQYPLVPPTLIPPPPYSSTHNKPHPHLLWHKTMASFSWLSVSGYMHEFGNGEQIKGMGRNLTMKSIDRKETWPKAPGKCTYVFTNYQGGWHFEFIWLFQPIPMYWIIVALRRATECFTMHEVIITMETCAVPLVIMQSVTGLNSFQICTVFNFWPM